MHKDYGVSWDESIDRENGIVNAKYILAQVAPRWTGQQAIFAHVPEFATLEERDHGVLFHLPLAFMEVFWPGIDSRTYYLVRHFCIFLTFVLGLWSVYKLALVRFGSWQLGLLASTLLLLSPRFFADAFSNGKDLVFLGFFTFGVYTLVSLLQRPTLTRATLHGLATAMATDVRILGSLLVALSLGMFLLEAFFGPPENARRVQLVKTLGWYVVVAAVLTVAGWPFLWEGPLDNFILAFNNMKHFRVDGYVLYLGEKVQTTHLPWHYAPLWILITTPIAYSVAFLIGISTYMYTLGRRLIPTLRTAGGRIDLLLSAWFFIPLFMVIVLGSVIYDGWRHLYFIYPAFLLLAVRGAYGIWQLSRQYFLVKRLALLAAVLAVAEAGYTLARMIQAHPNQQVYYSFLSSREAEQLFEGDYWGLSYRKGLEWILANNPAAQITVDAPFPILLENNLAVLKPADRARFKIAPPNPEGYFLTAYRTHPEPYPTSVGNEVYAVRVNGIRILSVFYRW
ncbi:hypothetical protein [Hymenobacter sp. BT730]|uniref:hypothetical protein n=1 Tax=Hymenobacter sp. BT730 TaxID=3063332 RepID=UPI0026E0EB6F|nr:hypothetical protein [Hymenobacter sp. BT730]